MSKKNSAAEHDKFFASLKLKEIEKTKRKFFIFMAASLIMMFALSIFSLFLALLATMKPTPVIAFDKEGKRLLFSSNETVESETSKVRVHRFMTDFVNKFEGISPNVEEELKDAYNMLTPKFRQILLDKAVHKEKIEAWKNKNFQTKFRIIKIRFLEGSLSVGSNLLIEGVGEMSFKAAIDYSGEGEQRKDYVYFNALLVVTPVTLDLSPDGLFVDAFTGKTLGDFRSLRAYLLENKKEYLIDDDKREIFE